MIDNNHYPEAPTDAEMTAVLASVPSDAGMAAVLDAAMRPDRVRACVRVILAEGMLSASPDLFGWECDHVAA